MGWFAVGLNQAGLIWVNLVVELPSTQNFMERSSINIPELTSNSPHSPDNLCLVLVLHEGTTVTEKFVRLELLVNLNTTLQSQFHVIQFSHIISLDE